MKQESKEELILKEYYEYAFCRSISVGVAPKFEDLTIDQKKALKNMVGYQGYKLHLAWENVKSEFIKSMPEYLKRWLIRS